MRLPTGHRGAGAVVLSVALEALQSRGEHRAEAAEVAVAAQSGLGPLEAAGGRSAGARSATATNSRFSEGDSDNFPKFQMSARALTSAVKIHWIIRLAASDLRPYSLMVFLACCSNFQSCGSH